MTGRWAKLCRNVLLALFCAGLALFIAMERLVVSGADACDMPGDDISCVIVLGAGVNGTEPSAFVTSDFHVCRAKLLSGAPQAYGAAACLPGGACFSALTLNYYVREAFVLANEFLLRMDLDV